MSAEHTTTAPTDGSDGPHPSPGASSLSTDTHTSGAVATEHLPSPAATSAPVVVAESVNESATIAQSASGSAATPERPPPPIDTHPTPVTNASATPAQATPVEPNHTPAANGDSVENLRPSPSPSHAVPISEAASQLVSEVTKQSEPAQANDPSNALEATLLPVSSPLNDSGPVAGSHATVTTIAPERSEPSPPIPAPAPAAAVDAEPLSAAAGEAAPPATEASLAPATAATEATLPATEASPLAAAAPVPALALASAAEPSKRSPSPSPSPSASPPAASATPAAAAAGAPSVSASPPPSSSSSGSSFFRSIMTAFASLKDSSSSSRSKEDPAASTSPAAANAAAASASPQPPFIPGQPTAAQLALCSQAESALAWGVQQDVIHSHLSPSVRSVADYTALQMAETEAVQRWIVEMRTPVDWAVPEHHALLERLWASYACVLQPPSNTGQAQSPLSMRAPPFPGKVSQSWKLLGFQGTNPATDFRGVGLLSLQVLVYLGEEHKELVHVLMSLQNAALMRPREYPLACAGINLVCAVINMMEMDAPAASSASRNGGSNAGSASISSLSSSGSNFSANPANNSVAPGFHGSSRSAAKADLQGPAGKFLNQLSATVSEVTRKIKDKLDDVGSADSAAGANATQASAAATAAEAEATAAAAAAVAAAGCSVRLDPLEDQLNALLARLGKNRLFRLFVRHKAQVAAPMTEEEAAAAALLSPASRRSRLPQSASAGAAAPALPFRPASAEQLASIHSIGELLAVLFPLLDDLWVDENANYFGRLAHTHCAQWIFILAV